jgi:tight adherence protein C
VEMADLMLRFGDVASAVLLGVCAIALAAVSAREWIATAEARRRVGASQATSLPNVAQSQGRASLEALIGRLGRVGGAAGEDTALRLRLRQAGIQRSDAVIWFYGSRVLLVLLLAPLMLLVASVLAQGMSVLLALAAGGIGAGIGYILPSFALDFRIAGLRKEYQEGFPDVLDLLVICVESGLGVEAGLARICEELGESFPNLRKVLTLTLMEVRAGRDRAEAFRDLGIRLGIPEAISFGRLVVQTEELGSSIAQTLRIAADEMRVKRITRAEEYAMSLPVRLTVPLGIFVFPGIMVVTLLPAAIGIYESFILGGISGE